MSKYLFLLFFLFIGYSDSYKIEWDNTVDFDFNNFGNFSRADEIRMPNWFFIFPGTKWCGVGNIAENNDDLGQHRDTDKCCRNHDFCPDSIEAYQTKYNLTNSSFYTRLNCECDKEFYKCLKSINSRTSTQVGHMYFTVIGTQCFANEYPISGCKKYTYFPKQKCVEYDYDENQEKVYQWFDVQNF